MGWTIYVKDNDDGKEFLEIITREPPGTFTSVVEVFEKASMFANDSYMKKGKKTVRGKQKMLRVLMQEARPVRKQIAMPPEKSYNNVYDNMMHDVMFSSDQDEDDGDNTQDIKIRQKEEIDKKASEMQAIREKSRPPPKVQKDSYADDPEYNESPELEEDRMNDYLSDLIKRHGND
jgi:hypothetical protein